MVAVRHAAKQPPVDIGRSIQIESNAWKYPITLSYRPRPRGALCCPAASHVMAFVGSSKFTIEGDANNIVQGNQNVYNIQTAYFQVETEKDDDGEEYKQASSIFS
ncbi:hypothetical protein AAF712_006630 [Marasmius tenuissimus]|uniref:Uncharacterized protein n=1 Tax=Marasmius tenuissimus TaxID=585030 RepID=A0ABR2ZXQ1_9AGAR